MTHALHVLPQADQIVVMADGAIAEIGSYQELLHKKGALVGLLDGARQPGGGGEGGTDWLLLSICTWLLSPSVGGGTLHRSIGMSGEPGEMLTAGRSLEEDTCPSYVPETMISVCTIIHHCPPSYDNPCGMPSHCCHLTDDQCGAQGHRLEPGCVQLQGLLQRPSLP